MKPVWDPDAEKLHCISLRLLIRDGRPPLEIATRMNQVLAGRELFSDSPVDDERWLKLLFGAAGIEPAFTVDRRNADRLTRQVAAELGWDVEAYEAVKAEAEQLFTKRHRAEADARYWACVWQIVSKRGDLRPRQ
jgi:hypothetical protein